MNDGVAWLNHSFLQVNSMPILRSFGLLLTNRCDISNRTDRTVRGSSLSPPHDRDQCHPDMSSNRGRRLSYDEAWMKRARPQEAESGGGEEAQVNEDVYLAKQSDIAHGPDPHDGPFPIPFGLPDQSPSVSSTTFQHLPTISIDVRAQN